jgi:hypothetical protein
MQDFAVVPSIVKLLLGLSGNAFKSTLKNDQNQNSQTLNNFLAMAPE